MEKIKETSCGIIPVFKNEKGDFLFLILQNVKGDNNWSFPKGHVENSETELETAKRELAEETGIVNIRIIESLRYSDRYDFFENTIKIDKTVVFFIGFVDDIKVTPQTVEVKSFKWADYAEVQKTFNFDGQKKILDQVIKDLNNIKLN